MELIPSRIGDIIDDLNPLPHLLPDPNFSAHGRAPIRSSQPAAVDIEEGWSDPELRIPHRLDGSRPGSTDPAIPEVEVVRRDRGEPGDGASSCHSGAARGIRLRCSPHRR